MLNWQCCLLSARMQVIMAVLFRQRGEGAAYKLFLSSGTCVCEKRKPNRLWTNIAIINSSFSGPVSLHCISRFAEIILFGCWWWCIYSRTVSAHRAASGYSWSTLKTCPLYVSSQIQHNLHYCIIVGNSISSYWNNVRMRVLYHTQSELNFTAKYVTWVCAYIR